MEAHKGVEEKHGEARGIHLYNTWWRLSRTLGVLHTRAKRGAQQGAQLLTVEP